MLCACGAVLLPFVPYRTYLTELIANFLPYTTFATAILIAAACFLPKIRPLHRFMIALPLIAAVVTSLVTLSPFFFISSPATANEQHSVGLRLIAANVLRVNTQHRELLRDIRHQNADCLIGIEIDKQWDESVKRFLPHHSKIVMRRSLINGYGIGLYCDLSKVSVSNARVFTFNKYLPPNIEADITISNRTLKLVGTHTKNPISPSGWRSRDRHLWLLSEYLRTDRNSALVLLGDLNLPPWTPSYTRFIRDAALIDHRTGEGLLLSWSPLTTVNTKSAPVSFSMLPIDHALSRGLSEIGAAAKMSLVPITGSDHQAVQLDITFGAL